MAVFAGLEKNQSNMRVMQTALFKVPELDEEKLGRMIAPEVDGDLFAAFGLLKEGGYGCAGAVWEIVRRRMITDWKKIWDEFEREGFSTYLPEITLFGVKLEVIEKDSEMMFFVNEEGRQIFVWTENDVFDSKTMAKIKSAIRAHIYNNEGQLRHLFEQLPFEEKKQNA